MDGVALRGAPCLHRLTRRIFWIFHEVQAVVMEMVSCDRGSATVGVRGSCDSEYLSDLTRRLGLDCEAGSSNELSA
jgi:hypothetical protein